MLSAEKAVIGPASKVKELTASLDEMLGLPEGTRLELVPPDPLVEDASLTEITDKSLAANAEIIEAEQTALKAHAAATISKMEYAPTVAALGGYTNQTSINLVFPRAAGYIGATASWTIFDFGKREHGVQESKANAEAADLGVQLVKAKVAAGVKSSSLELERSRQLYQLARGWSRRLKWLRPATSPTTRKPNWRGQQWKQTCFVPSSSIARRMPS